jgi:hypothetical protein
VPLLIRKGKEMAKKRDINKLFDLDQIVVAMQEYVPVSNKRRKDAKSYLEIAEVYLKEVVEQATLKPRDEYQIKLDLYNLALDKIRIKMGRYSTKDKKQLWWREWFDNQAWSLYTIVNKGNNMTEQNTLVKLNFELSTAEDIINWDTATILKHFPQDDNVDGYWYSAIDHASLNAYIMSTQAALKQGNYDKNSGSFVTLNHNQTETYKENLKTALMIQTLSRDSGQLRQGVKQSEFGRLYFKGINLQNCHKIVRTAALGNCHSYDLVSASQAWRINECQKIEPATYPYTQELLDNKLVFRNRVAHIMMSKDLELAKQVLTSIGFGANITDKPWPGVASYNLPALREILTDEQLTRLTLSPWFMGFVEEQQAMNNLIYNHFKSVWNKSQYPECIKDKGGKIVKNKCLAWLYQNTEFEYIQALHNYILTRCSDDNILLLVHDAIYLKLSIDVTNLNGILQMINPYLKIEHTKHTAYTFEDVFGILNHKKHIIDEETQALRYQIAKMEHAKWNDNEYKSSWTLFARDYDNMLDQTLWTDEEKQMYAELKDKYYMTWWKEVIMPNKKSLKDTLNNL